MQLDMVGENIEDVYKRLGQIELEFEETIKELSFQPEFSAHIGKMTHINTNLNEIMQHIKLLQASLTDISELYLHSEDSIKNVFEIHMT